MTRQQPIVPLRAIVIISIVVLAVFLLASAVQANGAPETTIDYEVEAGDTLWSIAEHHARPDGDVRHTIGVIRSLNEIDGTMIYAGDVLELPSG